MPLQDAAIVAGNICRQPVLHDPLSCSCHDPGVNLAVISPDKVVCAKASLVQVCLPGADPEHEFPAMIGRKIYPELDVLSLDVVGLDGGEQIDKVCGHSLVIVATGAWHGPRHTAITRHMVPEPALGIFIIVSADRLTEVAMCADKR